MRLAKLRDTTSGDWERLAQLDPYWAVLSNDTYHRENLSHEHLASFLKTGEDHTEEVWRICRHAFGGDFAPARVLDFGCGVGRVTLPLARRAESVVAVDVSDKMLSLTRALLDKNQVTNVELIKSDATLSSIKGPFDLVHSVLVLQHVPPVRGLWLIEHLVELAGETGAVVLQLLYYNPLGRSLPVRVASQLLRPLKRLSGRPPKIQMNSYPMNQVLKLIQEAGVRRIHVEFTDHDGHLGATLFLKRN